MKTLADKTAAASTDKSNDMVAAFRAQRSELIRHLWEESNSVSMLDLREQFWNGIGDMHDLDLIAGNFLAAGHAMKFAMIKHAREMHRLHKNKRGASSHAAKTWRKVFTKLNKESACEACGVVHSFSL